MKMIVIINKGKILEGDIRIWIKMCEETHKKHAVNVWKQNEWNLLYI